MTPAPSSLLNFVGGARNCTRCGSKLKSLTALESPGNEELCAKCYPRGKRCDYCGGVFLPEDIGAFGQGWVDWNAPCACGWFEG